MYGYHNAFNNNYDYNNDNTNFENNVNHQYAAPAQPSSSGGGFLPPAPMTPQYNQYNNYNAQPHLGKPAAVPYNQNGGPDMYHQHMLQQQLQQPVNLYQISRNPTWTPYEPPVIELPRIFEYSNVNCSPSVMRCTLSSVPQTQELLKRCRLPFGLVLHPFRDMKQLNVLQSSLIVRCRSCRAYINPFVSFPDQRSWKCNLCGRRNDLPDEFHYDPLTKTYGDANRRPEIKNATVEFIAPAEYMIRPPQIPVYYFLLDVSKHAMDIGYLDNFCSRLIQNIENIPGDIRTLIGFLCVDSKLHFFQLRTGLEPKELIVCDIEEPFLPTIDGVLVNLSRDKMAVISFLEQLPDFFRANRDTSFALGSALTATKLLLGENGARVTVMQTVLANVGLGALQSREDPNLRSAKEVTNVDAATDFYKTFALECSGRQIAIDLFVLSSHYVDLATISEVVKFSGGCLYYYPNFHSLRNVYELKRFDQELTRYLSRKIGFEAVLRVRCTRGLSLAAFHGNFFVRSTDLLNLPNVNPDSACAVMLQMEESLHDFGTVSFQSALLYTSSKGERRIRVHTLCLPIKKQVSEIFLGADAEAIASILAKMAVDRCLNGSLLDCREALLNASVDCLEAYANAHSLQQSAASLLAPQSLRTLPLFVLGLLKHTAFTFGTSIRLDSRLFSMCSLKTLPLDFLMLQINASLYALHLMSEQSAQPVQISLTYEKIEQNGLYLMDTGDWLLLFVNAQLQETICQNLFGVSNASAIEDDLDFLPELDNQYSISVRSFIHILTDKRTISSPLRIIRSDSPNRDLFLKRLIEDRTESTFSYVEFLRHIQNEMATR